MKLHGLITHQKLILHIVYKICVRFPKINTPDNAMSGFKKKFAYYKANDTPQVLNKLHNNFLEMFEEAQKIQINT